MSETVKTDVRRIPARMLSADDGAEILQVPKSLLYHWRLRDFGPKGRKVGKYLRYRPEDVEKWIAEQS